MMRKNRIYKFNLKLKINLIKLCKLTPLTIDLNIEGCRGKFLYEE